MCRDVNGQEERVVWKKRSSRSNSLRRENGDTLTHLLKKQEEQGRGGKPEPHVERAEKHHHATQKREERGGRKTPRKLSMMVPKKEKLIPS